MHPSSDGENCRGCYLRGAFSIIQDRMLALTWWEL